MKKDEERYYLVLVEAQVPAVLHYRIKSSSIEEAEKIIRFSNPIKIEYKINKRKNIFLRIYEYGTSMLHKAKSLL
jgi:hypothetical protein